MKRYLEFLRFCLNPQQSMPDSAQSVDWKDMMTWAVQQAIVGICFSGIERLKDSNVKVPFPILMEWIGFVNRIEQQNYLVNRRCVELVYELKNAEYDNCILKGQGNAILYDVRCEREEGRRMSLLRQPGDIDLLVDGDKKNIIKYVKQRYPHAKVAYQHIDYPIFKDVEVELHYLPTYLNNPIYNLRLKKWYKTQTDIFSNYVELPDGQGEIPVPTGDFNIVFQLAHMMHHFFDEGIGLRQMIDYYFLLKSEDNNQVQGLRFKVQESTKSMEETLKYLNLYKFAGAVMWVLHEVFGMEEDYYLVPPDEWRGKLLLDEILKGGNFGKCSGLTNHSIGVKHFLKIKRNLRFVRAYPSEALCEPFFRTWHFFWRMVH